MTDVAVFLLPSFQGPGDDHQRALLHAVSCRFPRSLNADCMVFVVTGCRLQVVHGSISIDVTCTHLSLNDMSRWRQASAAASVLQQRRARLQLPQARVAASLRLHSLRNLNAFPLTLGHHR